jgi:hypothetical protein
MFDFFLKFEQFSKIAKIWIVFRFIFIQINFFVKI